MRKFPLLMTLAVLGLPGPVLAQERPNIVLVFMDYVGDGERGRYGGGITRGNWSRPRSCSSAS